MQVGDLIALLAEEGDDISSIEAPQSTTAPAKPTSASEDKAADNHSDKSLSSSSSSSTSSESKGETSAQPETPSKDAKPVKASGDHAHPTHKKTLLPSVLRLLQLEGISDTSGIKATGPRGHLTKGDVLAHLGKIKSATGTEKVEVHGSVSAPSCSA